MCTTINLVEPLIFIGETHWYFDSDFQPKPMPEIISRPFYYKFHYLIVKEPGSAETKIFLTQIWERWNKCLTWSDALRKYMNEKNFSEITTHGGGEVEFEANEKTIRFSGCSAKFHEVSTEEVLSISKIIWPSFAVNSDFGDTLGFKAFPERLWSYDELGCSGGFY